MNASENFRSHHSMNIRQRIGATIIAMGAILPLYPGVASASDASSLPLCTQKQVQATWDGATSFTYSLKSWVKIDACASPASVYTLDEPDKWNGKGWNETAAPQTRFDGGLVSVTHEAQTVHLKAPECGPYQADFYTGPVQEKVTWPEGSHGFIAGGMKAGEKCGGSSSTTTTTSSSTTSTSPSSTSSTTSSTTSNTSTSSTTTTSSGTTSSTSSTTSPSTTTTTKSTSPRTSTTTTGGAVPVSGPTPPSYQLTGGLPRTGSETTPMLLLAGGLIALGATLTVAGRRVRVVRNKH